MSLSTDQRRAGLFIPVFAIRREGDLGVGDTHALCQMIDWAVDAGFSLLQILPINETSGDNSPYNAISSRALDITTLTASPDWFPGLKEDDIDSVVPTTERNSLGEGPVSYERVKEAKWTICRRVFDRLSKTERDEVRKWSEAETWVKPYALFRALMASHAGNPSWDQWPGHHSDLQRAEDWLRSLPDDERKKWDAETAFYAFAQRVLVQQWQKVREHADKRGIWLMGDIPFGISRSSADVWAQRDLFDLKWCGGAPPEPMFQDDPFTAKWGQNWGIPVYRWEAHREQEFAWWKSRVHGVTDIFHVFRVDHILGFYRIFAFPWKPEENASFVDLDHEQARDKAGDVPRFLPGDDSDQAGAKANREQGEELLKMVRAAAGDAVLVGEDLGVVPFYVRPSLTKLGISGFKIPIFERNESTREFTPAETYPWLAVTTLTTHDHETMAGFWDGWWEAYENGAKEAPEGQSSEAEMASWELYRLQRWAGLDDSDLIREFNPTVRLALHETLFACPAWLVIVMIPDLFGSKIRFNVPGALSESNWSERFPHTVKELHALPEAQEIVRLTREQLKKADRLGA